MLGIDIPDIHMWFTLCLIVATIMAYASEKIPLEFTSIAIIAVLLLFFHLVPLNHPSGWSILTPEKLLRGFANPALITVLSLLVLGQAIVQTGALNEIANFILRISGNNVFISISITLLFVMVVSAILNNTPVVVIFIPIMAALARGVGVSVSRVMIPLSFVSILGGMTTLIGSSTNLLVSGIMTELGQDPLGLFDFTVPGIIMAGVGLVYILFVVPHLLPDRASLVRDFAGEDENRQFVAQIEIDYSSDFVGQKLDSGAIPGFSEISVRMVQRGEHAFLPPFDDDMIIRPRDIIILAAPKKELANFFAKNPESIEKHLAVLGDDADEDEEDLPKDITMAEIVVAPASRVVGRNLEQTGFHQEYNCVVLGIQRQSRIIRTKVTETRLAPGDVLLVMGRQEDILKLGESRDFLLMEWSTEELHSGKKAGLVGLIFAAVVGLAAADIIPITVTAFAGVAAILLTNCLNIRQAIRALDLKIVLLIAASLALGTALQATGGASFLAHILIDLMHGAPAIAIMSALFVLMVVLTNVLSNNATAVLFTPIAINLATQLEVDPKMFLFAVIFACNCSFVTPIGYQTNLMVMAPGHYKFHDFIKAGIPLAAMIWIAYTIFAGFYF